MSTSTFGIIIMILGFLTIAMTLVAAYFAAMWKDEQRKNQMLMKKKSKIWWAGRDNHFLFEMVVFSLTGFSHGILSNNVVPFEKTNVCFALIADIRFLWSVSVPSNLVAKFSVAVQIRF